MELISDDLHFLELIISDLEFNGVVFFVQTGVNFEASFGACAGNQIDHNLQRLQRDAQPVSGEVTKLAMFDLVLFARAWREVTDFHNQSRRIGQPLQFQSPPRRTSAVAAFW
jgi:hypothetical protein